MGKLFPRISRLRVASDLARSGEMDGAIQILRDEIKRCDKARGINPK